MIANKIYFAPCDPEELLLKLKTEEDKHGPPGMGIKFIDTMEEDKEALLKFLLRSQVTQKGY